MGLFDIFKINTPESTAETMISAYNSVIDNGGGPKKALASAFNSIKNRTDLRDMNAEYYFEGCFGDDYKKLNRNNDEARKFAVRAILNIMMSYVHLDLMESMMDSSGKYHSISYLLESKIK